MKAIGVTQSVQTVRYSLKIEIDRVFHRGNTSTMAAEASIDWPHICLFLYVVLKTVLSFFNENQKVTGQNLESTGCLSSARTISIFKKWLRFLFKYRVDCQL